MALVMVLGLAFVGGCNKMPMICSCVGPYPDTIDPALR